MGLLDRYIFREILASSVLGTLLATFIVFLRTTLERLFEVLVGSSNATPLTVLELFSWGIPPLLPLTIPFGVLVGILIGLGRLSSDSEIIAMRAAGVSSRKVIAPVLLFAVIGMALAAFASLRLSPLAMRETFRIENALFATQLSAEIEARVFDENFPNHILFVGDVAPGPVNQWRHVFIADVTPPEQRTSGMKEKAWGPMVTVAPFAIAVSDTKHNRIQLDMRNASTHEMGRDLVANDQTYEYSQQVLDASPPKQKSLTSPAVNTRQLMIYNGPDWLEYKIELHKRFALPVACFVLAMVGIPLGITTRKGGKSAAYVYAIFLAFFGYYLSFITLSSVAKEQKLPVPVALWLPDAALAVAGIVFLARMELPGDGDLVVRLKGVFTGVWSAVKSKTASSGERRLRGWRLPLLPQIIDTYLLSGFLFYVAVWLAGFVSLTLVFNFFDLMSDMVRNHIALPIMFEYLFFLTPLLIYETLPISILVAVLVTLGVLSKQNEITAFRACGVSLYRMAMPILLCAVLFSGALFAFDYYYVPGANRKQEDLRDKIKHREPQSWQRPDRKWIMFPDASRIYYYETFDTTEKVMANVNVFDLDPNTFELRHEIVAGRARWRPDLTPKPGWVFENGWSEEFRNKTNFSSTRFDFKSFPELTEPPESFLREVPPDKQMNFMQLDRYITDLKRSGISTTKLQVRLYRKFSAPLFALIMAMIAVPFGFMVGNRGAMTGIGVSIAIGMVYLGLGTLAEKVGDVNLLTPPMAAWTPDMVFALAGLFLLMRMRS